MARIFIIDDDPMILRFCEAALAAKGHRCRSFEAPEAALAEIETGESRPDLVLLDLVMPDVSGIEILERLKAIAPGLPVIVSTASDRQEDVIDALRRDAANFIKKPLEPEILESAVRRALQEASILRQNAELLERLRRQNEQLREQKAEISKELRVAGRVQEWMMKVDFVPMRNFIFHHHHLAATHVTGDFIDVLRWPGDDRQGVLFVDISGHGVSAALIAPVFRLIARQCLAASLPPGEALHAIAEKGRDFFDDGRYASLLYVLLDAKKARATVAKGGQEPALLVRRGAAEVEAINPEGFPIGMDLAALLGEETIYEEVTLDLAPGDRLVLYTDGLVEAAPAEAPDEFYGRDRFGRFLVNAASLTAGDLAERLFEDVLHHTGARHFLDDSTLAIIEAID